MGHLIEIIHGLIVSWGAFGVFTGSIIEEVISIIPSALIQLGAGFFMLQGMETSVSSIIFLLIHVALPASLGLAIGSLVFYAIGYVGGKPIIEKYGKFFTVSWDMIEKFEDKFSHTAKDEFAFFVARTIPGVPSVVLSTLSGVVRMNLFKYTLLSFLGTIPRAFILGFIGWKFGNSYTSLAGNLSIFENSILGLIIVLVAIFFSYHLLKKKQV
jgi:membrane protein DedA with SNARE-associated domain